MIRSITRAAAFAATLTLIASQALAHMTEVQFGELTFSQAFTRAMPPSAGTGGGYVTITNTGTEADRLIAVSSPAAPVAQLHQMKMDGDVMMMSELPDGIVIPVGESVALAPGGLHIMFMQVPAPFAEGDVVSVTLTFERAGQIDLELPVAPIGAKSAPIDHSGH